MGQKCFKSVTEDEQVRCITAQVTDVDTPLLSVHQIVEHGSTVGFSPSSSYIDTPGGQRLTMEPKGNVYMPEVWVPKDQGKMSFQGHPSSQL